jgi:hypothetical protein
MKGKHNRTAEEMLAIKPTYILERVRRTVPHKSLLVPALEAFWDRWSRCTYYGTDQPILHEEAKQSFDNIVKLAADGSLSDPPDVKMYEELGEDKDTLMRYRYVTLLDFDSCASRADLFCLSKVRWLAALIFHRQTFAARYCSFDHQCTARLQVPTRNNTKQVHSKQAARSLQCGRVVHP